MDCLDGFNIFAERQSKKIFIWIAENIIEYRYCENSCCYLCIVWLSMSRVKYPALRHDRVPSVIRIRCDVIPNCAVGIKRSQPAIRSPAADGTPQMLAIMFQTTAISGNHQTKTQHQNTVSVLDIFSATRQLLILRSH